MEKINIEKFFNTDYVDSASYNNLRSIASYTDGLKNSNRKIIHTVLKKNINSKTKVSRLQSTVSEFTEYLHGEDGIGKVCVNMAQNFAGTNNIPLLQRNGSFGNRIDHVAAASRYIYTQKEPYLDSLFRKEDYNVLITQSFEGVVIEPKYFMPIIPMICINGSQGVSIGFAQKILPRNPEVVISELNKVLSGEKKLNSVNLGTPYWKGFNGKVVQDIENPSKWNVYGNLILENKNNIIIDELPVGYDLKKYIGILDKLDDDGKIVSYKDLSEDGKFKFKIRVKREFTEKNDIEKLYTIFKLKVPMTENFTCIDENNKIRVFESMEDIFISYFKLRMEYFSDRKEYLIKSMNESLDVLNSKLIFIQSVISGDIEVNNKTKKNIITQIEKNGKIIKVDDSYDYLLRLPIYSLTKEKVSEIKSKIKELKSEINSYSSETLESLWASDINDIKI